MEKIISLPNGSLASRRLAIPYRDEVIKAFNDSSITTVVFDLTNVEIISGSFADECVGILVKIYGFAEVKKKVRIRNGNGIADKSIAKAILDRKLEMEQMDKNIQCNTLAIA